MEMFAIFDIGDTLTKAEDDGVLEYEIGKASL